MMNSPRPVTFSPPIGEAVELIKAAFQAEGYWSQRTEDVVKQVCLMIASPHRRLTVKDRIIEFAMFSQEKWEQDNPGVVLTRTRLAVEIGSSRETVSRVLTDLAKKGIDIEQRITRGSGVRERVAKSMSIEAWVSLNGDPDEWERLVNG